MSKVAQTIRKYHKQPSDEFTDIYNRAWEAVYHALQDVATLSTQMNQTTKKRLVIKAVMLKEIYASYWNRRYDIYST